MLGHFWPLYTGEEIAAQMTPKVIAQELERAPAIEARTGLISWTKCLLGVEEEILFEVRLIAADCRADWRIVG